MENNAMKIEFLSLSQNETFVREASFPVSVCS